MYDIILFFFERNLILILTDCFSIKTILFWSLDVFLTNGLVGLLNGLNHSFMHYKYSKAVSFFSFQGYIKII